MFGDIVKVTPTSKVVGDMAIMMVTSRLTRRDVEAPDTEIAFPESVVQLMHGDIGQPEGGFPPALQAKVLQGRAPLTQRPGATLPPVDLEAKRREAEQRIGRVLTDAQLASWLMYPKVFEDYARDRAAYGDIGMLPTPVFFYGMEPGQEVSLDIERGKTLIVRYVALSEVHDDGTRTVFFELNGQPRSVRVRDAGAVARRPSNRKAEPGNALHVAAPMPGRVVTVVVRPGQRVARGDTLLTLEAMKMEAAVRAEADATVAEVLVTVGAQVDARDLLVAFSAQGA
jgi:pyruvate carboxylase